MDAGEGLGSTQPIAWNLEDAKRELLELRLANMELRERLARLERIIYDAATVDGPQEGEPHEDWDYGQELEARNQE